MSDYTLYLWMVIGVIISVVLPIFIKWMKEISDTVSRGAGDVMANVWQFAKPYIKIAVASAVIGLIALAVYRAGLAGDKIDNWAKALLYGYVWDSTFQKVFTTK